MTHRPILLAIGGDRAEDWLPVFAEHYPQEMPLWHDPAKPDPRATDAEYAIVWAPDASLFTVIPNVAAIFSLGAGVDHITRSGIALPDVPVVRYVNDDLTARMGEWIVLQCLLHLRQHLAYTAQAKARQWRPLPQPGAEDVTIGIMGLGVLGQHAAEKLLALGFTVTGWSRTPKSVPGVQSFAGASEFDAFLKQTDMLVSLLPRTAETEGLVTRTLIMKLRRDGALGGPVYINAGRGKTQVDADIAACLGDGTLKGASLDVFSVEPLPADSPLWEAPNLVITPHVAAWSKRENVVHHAMRQILRRRQGLPLDHVIDRKAGY